MTNGRFRLASRLSFSTGLKAGFGAMLLLLASAILIGLARMASINQHVEQIVYKNNVKISLANDMKNAARDRAILMHSIASQSDPFEQQQHLEDLYHGAAAFTNARLKLEAIELSPEERNTLTRLLQATIKTQPLVVKSVDLAMEGKLTEALELISKGVVPLQKEVAARIDELIALQKLETDQAVRKMTQSYENARLLMLLFGGLATLLGLVIAVVVARSVDKQTRRLQKQATFDALTQLPNRVLFDERLQQAVLLARREKWAFALIVVDLNRFKQINDTLGHHVGDLVLKHVAGSIRACLRESDTVARMGGDEFTILLVTAHIPEGAIVVAKKIVRVLSTPFEAAGHKLEIGASLGVAMFPGDGEDPAELMRNADAAMYMAKQAHIGFRVYSKELRYGVDDRMALQGDLRHAIVSEELVLHYQPTIEFDTERVCGVEALVRWQHPTHGLMAPDKFIPLAEQTGLIKPLTEWVLRAALHQCKQWQQAGLAFTVSVNVSALDIQDAEFPGKLASLLGEFAVSPQYLELEITESAVMSEPLRAVACIRQLSALGLQIAIDDFGTGYSSMTYLKELLVTKIKIDKSFVKDMTVRHHDAVIVRSTVELGHSLGLKVVAEGVEDQAAWDRLKALGCDLAQGYFMSRPLPAQEILRWLESSPWRPPLGKVAKRTAEPVALRAS